MISSMVFVSNSDENTNDWNYDELDFAAAAVVVVAAVIAAVAIYVVAAH